MEPRAGHTQLSANRGCRAYKGLPSKMVETQEDFHHRFLGTGRSLKIWEFSPNRRVTVSLPHFSTYYLPLEPHVLTVTINQPITRTAAAAKSLRSCPTLCDPIDSSPPGSPSLGFSRQEHWSGLPFPSPMHESEKGK